MGSPLRGARKRENWWRRRRIKGKMNDAGLTGKKGSVVVVVCCCRVIQFSVHFRGGSCCDDDDSRSHGLEKQFLSVLKTTFFSFPSPLPPSVCLGNSSLLQTPVYTLPLRSSLMRSPDNANVCAAFRCSACYKGQKREVYPSA